VVDPVEQLLYISDSSRAIINILFIKDNNTEECFERKKMNSANEILDSMRGSQFIGQMKSMIANNQKEKMDIKA